MRCSSVVELVTDYLEDALPPARRIGFRRHLARCRDCAVFLAQMRTTIRLSGFARAAFGQDLRRTGRST